jgi:tetratricopeptide (TPR) repeat protein
MTRLLFFSLALTSVFFSSPLEASKRKLVSDTDNTEGALIRYFISVPPPPDKAGLMESFATQYPQHVSTTWVLGELQALYIQAGKFDQAIAAGDRILAVDPDDLVIAQENLRAAEATKDPAKIRRAANVALTAAARLHASPQEDASFVKQVATYAEYTLYNVASNATPTARRTEWLEEFAREHPRSPYTPRIRPDLFAAYQHAGHHTRALQLAEEDLRAGTNNADMLLYAATRAYEKRDKTKGHPLRQTPPGDAPSRPGAAGNRRCRLGPEQTTQIRHRPLDARRPRQPGTALARCRPAPPRRTAPRRPE